MFKSSRLLVGVALAVVLTVVGVTAASASKDPRAATYRVTITNLTGGQALTPPVVAIQRRRVKVFRVGRASSFEVKEIAENGNIAPLLDSLGANDRVIDVTAVADGAGGPAPIVPASNPGGTPFGSSQTFTLVGDKRAKYFSWVSMLICTNDGFTGVSSLRLPHRVGDIVTVETNGYDAGTEINTEAFADIVPPCQSLIGGVTPVGGTGTSNPALAEGSVIHHHPGIQGGADLDPLLNGWVDPVARVEIERVG